MVVGLNIRLGLGITVSSVVKVRVRFKIRLCEFVAVPASDHSAELAPVHESSQ